MAINIPGVGEGLNKEYIRAFTFGGSSDADIQLTAAQLGTGGATVPLVNVNEGNVFVKNIEVQVASKLTTSTGTFTIGDTDVDGFWTDTLINGAATGAVFMNMTSTVAYAQGRLYTSSDVINLTKAGAAASAVSAASLVKVRVRYIRNSDTNLAPVE